MDNCEKVKKYYEIAAQYQELGTKFMDFRRSLDGYEKILGIRYDEIVQILDDYTRKMYLFGQFNRNEALKYEKEGALG